MADDCRRQGFELERRIFELDSKCASLRTEKQDDDYLQNASAILDKLKSFYRQGGESNSLPKLLQDYTQENKLVDQEFPEDCSPFKIQQLLQDLTEPEVLAGRLFPAQEVRGALLYMYCHTLHQRKQWIKKNKATFLKCLQEGVRYLMRMLQVRNSVKLNDGVYEDCSVDSTERKEDRLHFRDIGTQILHKYVLACDGPLQGQGWNTENAKEILSILQ
ncbi:unnamed protein product [Coregonus sp. 'balchen']|nr:unnamed protein product [Coregonus sp. 'balchen']